MVTKKLKMSELKKIIKEELETAFKESSLSGTGHTPSETERMHANLPVDQEYMGKFAVDEQIGDLQPTSTGREYKVAVSRGHGPRTYTFYNAPNSVAGTLTGEEFNRASVKKLIRQISKPTSWDTEV